MENHPETMAAETVNDVAGETVNLPDVTPTEDPEWAWSEEGHEIAPDEPADTPRRHAVRPAYWLTALALAVFLIAGGTLGILGRVFYHEETTHPQAQTHQAAPPSPSVAPPPPSPSLPPIRPFPPDAYSEYEQSLMLDLGEKDPTPEAAVDEETYLTCFALQTNNAALEKDIIGIFETPVTPGGENPRTPPYEVWLMQRDAAQAYCPQYADRFTSLAGPQINPSPASP